MLGIRIGGAYEASYLHRARSMLGLTEREILIHAAHAAGYLNGPHNLTHPDGIVLYSHWPVGGGMHIWNPLRDDGDCLRLGAILGISAIFDRDAPELPPYKHFVATYMQGSYPSYAVYGDDLFACVRAAITGMAAILGRNAAGNSIPASCATACYA